MRRVSDFLRRRYPQAEPLLFTLILIAYFLPWINHAAAGLTLIGLDVSEWVKFLPQMQSGELPNRDYLYLPPLLLGGCLALSTLWVDQSRWQRWLLRFLALGVGLIAFPSFDAIRFEDASQWRPRLIWIALLAIWSLLLVPLIGRFSAGNGQKLIISSGLLVLALGGGILPAVVLLPTQRVVGEWLNIAVSPGAGFYLSTAGFFVLALLAAFQLVSHLSD
ncbi:MAG: hypothetical protein QNJ45_03185 [Ardenticatenaceae bacterium]|nr:hypothetical protein [Ardenticatenaceae bacterium]